MSKVPHSNLAFLKQEFSDIIQKDRDTDQTGHKSSLSAIRGTFVFIDKSYLSITEMLDKYGYIDVFWYDWYDCNKNIIAKFHSEEHDAKDFQTITEPFHIHGKGLLDNKRLPNYKFRDLFSILELIRIVITFIR